MKKFIIPLFMVLASGVVILSVNLWQWTREYENGSHFNPPKCFKDIPSLSAPEFGCSLSLPSQYGTITYKYNEVRLRERPVAAIKDGQVLVLGSNQVEGLGLPAESTIPQLLEARLESSLGLQFINVGKSSGGTISMVLVAGEAIKRFKPSRMLWILSEDDLRQDLFIDQATLARDESGLPIKVARRAIVEKDPLLSMVSGIFQHVGNGSDVHKAVIAHLWSERGGSRIAGFDACKAIRKLEKVSEAANAPIKFVLIPSGPEHSTKVLKAHLSLLSVCPSSSPLDLSASLGGAENFQTNHTDLSKQGAEKAADLIAKVLAEEWRVAR